MKNQTEGRFDELYGKEYDAIVRLTCPHFNELQDTVRDSIEEYLQSATRAPIMRPSIMNVINVLELGVGTGETTRRISTLRGPVMVFAVDNSQEMLEIARRNIERRNPWNIVTGRVILLQADALDYLKAVPAGTVHVFASAFTLHNFDADYRSAVLEEICRTLRPGGLFVNADKYACDDAKQHEKTLRWQLALTEKKFDEINRPDLKKAALEHFKQDNGRRRLMREGKSKREMARLGFEKIKTVYREKMEATVQAIRR